MTPEERAADLWTRPGAPSKKHIAAEIRAAAEEMRERCAALAAEKWNCGGSVVAKAIRELKP